MDTESLRLFVLAAEMRNISQAGRQLGFAPAVSSARLAKLEVGLGVELLHRTTRNVVLSSDGEAFLPYAREILAQEDAALAALGRGQAEVSGVLRFAAPSTFAQLYLMPVVPRFQEAYPKVELDLRLSDTQQDLIEGSFDFALRNAPPHDTSLKGRRLADDQRILCASPDYLAARGVPEEPADLTSHRLIAFQSLAPKRLSGPEDGMFDPRASGARLIVDDGASLREASLSGAGISINALWSVAREIGAGRLVRVLPDYTVDDGAALWLIYPKSNVLTAKVRVFIDFLVAEVGPRLSGQLTPEQ